MPTETTKLPRPDFGISTIEVQGLPMTCRYMAPGLTAHDLIDTTRPAFMPPAAIDPRGRCYICGGRLGVFRLITRRVMFPG